VRLAKHKSTYNGCCSKTLFETSDNVKIELIELYPCNSKDELNKREGELIRSMDCVNKNIAGRTYKEYYVENKEYYKKYNEDHKEKIKEYREEHKTEAKEYQKEYRKANTEYIKDYYQKNKEEILGQQKEYYQKNKAKIKS
tara:strand:+ start:184 stop:606 length:423 start_codon:yes stop_codon:yes gene_type:complete